jgi:hypothetical protein
VNGSRPVVYGAMWCKDCRRSKELLSGRKRIPVINFDDGLVLSEPSDAELEQALRERGLVST